MVEVQGTQPSELFAATGSSGSPMQRLRHDVAMAGLRFGHVRRNHVNAPVAVRELERSRGKDVCVTAVQGCNQRSLASAHQCNRVLRIAIGHQRGHGAEDFDVVHLRTAIGVARA